MMDDFEKKLDEALKGVFEKPSIISELLNCLETVKKRLEYRVDNPKSTFVFHYYAGAGRSVTPVGALRLLLPKKVGQWTEPHMDIIQFQFSVTKKYEGGFPVRMWVPGGKIHICDDLDKMQKVVIELIDNNPHIMMVIVHAKDLKEK